MKPEKNIESMINKQEELFSPDILAQSHGQCQVVRVNLKKYDGSFLRKTWVFSFQDELNSEASLIHIWFYSNLSKFLNPGCIISDNTTL